MSPGAARAQVRGLLATLADDLPTLDARRRGAELYGSPRLNAFTLFAPGENTLSRIIADLLDPAGAHGQQSLFIDVLFRGLGLPPVRGSEWVRVRREVLTPARRRIDLLIETARTLVGIENKPWAVQQPDQLADYLAALDGWARGRTVQLVFLSDQEPQSARGLVRAVPFAGEVGELTLASLLEAGLERIRSQRARIHVEEFLAYIDHHFGAGTMTDTSIEPYVEAVEAEFESAEHRRAVGAVLLAQRTIHRRIVDEIGEFVLISLRALHADFEIDGEQSLHACLSEKYEPWSLRRPSWPDNLYVAIEADKKGFDDIYFGIRAPSPADREIRDEGEACEARALVDAAVMEVTDGNRTKWWPWWRSTKTPSWKSEFAAGFVVLSPNGAVGGHPEIAAMTETLVALAAAIDRALQK